MAAEFIVSFSGLCVFISDETKVEVVLVDSVRNLPKHAPTLSVPAKAVRDDSSPADTVIIDRDGRRMAQWNLDRCTVDILPGGKTPPTGRVEFQRNADGDCPDDMDPGKKPTDLHWVADLQRAYPAGRLRSHMNPGDEGISAKLNLRAGYLKTRQIDQNIWVFQPQSGNPYRQALAGMVEYSLPVDATTVTLILARTGGERLIHVEGGMGVSILNLPGSRSHHVEGDTVHHFAALYHVFENPPWGNPPLPRSTGEGCRHEILIPDDPPLCPPAWGQR